MALELIIWFTDSIPGNAVCFALVGIFLGPCYPIVVMTVVDIIPPELQGGSIGWLASLGQGGSAIMPLYVLPFPLTVTATDDQYYWSYCESCKSHSHEWMLMGYEVLMI
jgi:MFS family permease